MSSNFGRPSDYTPELANEICEALSVSPVGLRKLCLTRPDFPDVSTIRLWVLKNPDFSDQYARAMRDRALWLAEDVEDIADDGFNDTYIDDEGNVKVDTDVLGRSRLRVDTRKWIASKLLPKVYGDHKRVEELETENDVMRKEMIELRSQLDAKNKKEY